MTYMWTIPTSQEGAEALSFSFKCKCCHKSSLLFPRAEQFRKSAYLVCWIAVHIKGHSAKDEIVNLKDVNVFRINTFWIHIIHSKYWGLKTLQVTCYTPNPFTYLVITHTFLMSHNPSLTSCTYSLYSYSLYVQYKHDLVTVLVLTVQFPFFYTSLNLTEHTVYRSCLDFLSSSSTLGFLWSIYFYWTVSLESL